MADAQASPRSARALLVAFTACLLYACFASGATALPQESWLQLALAVVATGNHYIFDIAAGMAAAALGYGLGFLASDPARLRGLISRDGHRYHLLHPTA